MRWRGGGGRRTGWWHRRMEVRVVVVAAAALVFVVLALVLWSTKRRRDVRLYVVDRGVVGELLPSLAGITHGALVDGNRVELLENGEFFTRLLGDLQDARESIHFETFLWEEGEVADRLARTLAERARDGVEVRVLVDASGGRGMSARELAGMEGAGCRVARYHPFRLAFLGTVNNRDHRKLVLVDGRVGYVGGHCVTDAWSGDAGDRHHYRDVSARVEGPVVAQLQSAFTENWVEQTGEVVAGERYFPALPEAGPSRAHLAYVSPSGATSSVELLYYLAIAGATRQVLIQNPYFLPDPDGLEMLERAARRGVDVRVMLPSAEATDNAIVQHASHHHYGDLLAAGVRIYEYRRTLLHQKVLTVDHAWSAIGSTNFDDRSFELNDEVSLGVGDPEVAARLEAIFAADLRDCDERHLGEWAHRSWWHKTLDAAAYLINEQL